MAQITQTTANKLAFQQSRIRVIGFILITAWIAFMVFNFDTTRYALSNLIGESEFAGLKWSAILAFMFCLIDPAILMGRLKYSRPNRHQDRVYLIFFVWLLGAIFNATLTWWAVSVAMIPHDLDFHHRITRQQWLTYIPPLVALVVLQTRILFVTVSPILSNSFNRSCSKE